MYLNNMEGSILIDQGNWSLDKYMQQKRELKKELGR